MEIEILIILACLPLYVINSFSDKYVSSKNGNAHNVFYNCLKFLIGSTCILPVFLLDGDAKFKLGAIGCGVFCGVMYAISRTVTLKGYERCSVAFVTLCHSAGMIVPCILGHFFWSERLTLISVLGIVLAIASIVLLKDGGGEKSKLDALGIVFGVIIFLTSGGVMVMQKLMGVCFADQSVAAYNFYAYFTAFFILGFFAHPVKKLRGGVPKSVFICAAASAVSNALISLIMTGLADRVPSVILFPLYNGLGIILVCVGSIFAFKEKLTPKKIVGLAVGLIGLFLVNL